MRDCPRRLSCLQKIKKLSWTVVGLFKKQYKILFTLGFWQQRRKYKPDEFAWNDQANDYNKGGGTDGEAPQYIYLSKNDSLARANEAFIMFLIERERMN